MLDTIDGQVQQLRKHLGDPKAVGDGHSNSAMAAEALGWRHPSGLLHHHRGIDAERILSDALSKLDNIEKTHKVVISTESLYVEGKKELDDTRAAMTDPRGYLAKKGLLKAFGL